MKAGTAEKTAARAMGKYRKRGFILAFLTPCTILFLIVYAYPLITIFLTSFCKWNYENFTAPEFLGWSNLFDNYIKLFRYDANFKMALVNSLKWVALTLLIQVPFTILVALTLSKKMRGWKFTRNMFPDPKHHLDRSDRSDLSEPVQSSARHRHRAVRSDLARVGCERSV